MTHHFPTPEHKKAAEKVIEIYQQFETVDVILLVNSLARGKGDVGSDLDVSVLLEPPLTDEGEAEWDAQCEQLYTQHQAFADLLQHGAHAHVHVDFWDGRFPIPSRFEAGGPDWFEVAIGNRLQYGVPLWQRNERYARLQAQWLPYYDDELRQKRLAEVKWFCRNNLSYIPFYVQRGLYFQAFDRLYNAFQEFLHLLFISQRRYPIAYNQWIREQIVEILGMPYLYTDIGEFLAIQQFQSQQLANKAQQLEGWIARYIE
jgi:predicted nucleotidyltransferase